MSQAEYQEAIKKAMQEQVVPQIFSAAQLAEMQLPHHMERDHYEFASRMAFEKGYEEFYNIVPQLQVNDERISDERLAAAPQSIKVTFEGETHDIPLRIYRHPGVGGAQKWEQQMAFKYASREAIEKLEPGLKDKFNLVSGKDYTIGYGIQWNEDGIVEAVYMLQLKDKDALAHKDIVKKHIEKRLKTITPGRPSQVRVMAPIVMLAS